jgi:hypothetical protein
MPGLYIYFGAFLLLAASVMCGLAASTCVQVFRLRNKRLGWRAGTLKGFPLFSTIFLSISLLLAAATWNYGSRWEIAASAFYLLISVSWFITSYFSSKRYVTDHGMVKNVNDPAQTVAWHQVHDFFVQKSAKFYTYTFIYRERSPGRLKRLMRLEIIVPEKKHSAFKKLISHKLGRHISCYDDETIDVNEFK